MARDRARPRRGKPRPEWRGRFLEALATTGNVAVSCRASGAHKSTAYRLRAADPDFAEAWDDALDDAADAMELEARRRAVNGTARVVFQRCGTDDAGRPIYAPEVVRTYSDTLLIFLLKGLRPEKYRERYDLAKLTEVAARVEAPGVGS